MNFSEVSPYIRYARYMEINSSSRFDEVVPVDSRLFYGISGHGKIIADNNIYNISSDTLLIINSSIPYHIYSPSEDVRYLMLNFDYTRRAASLNLPIPPVPKNSFSPSMLVDFNTFEDASSLSSVLYIEKIPQIRKKLFSIVNEYEKRLRFYDNKIGHILAECLSDVLRFYESGAVLQEKEITTNILTYIHENYGEHLSNITLGNKFGYHPNYINHIIKVATGMSLHHYVLNVKMMNAVSLLENTSLSIGEIAQLTGFCDIAYFSQYFKKYFGVSPTKYR